MSTAIVHSVHFYDESAALVSRLCGIVGSALRIGNAVLIIASQPHRDGLVKALGEANLDVREHARQRRFAMFDAEEILATFMRNGRPRRERFMDSIGSLLKEAKSNSKAKDVGLTVFGEMVAVLWEQGKKAAAIELEELWNEALSNSAFHLHCAYPRASFAQNVDEDFMAQVCRSHTHVTAA